MSCIACDLTWYASTSVPLGRETAPAFSPTGVTIQCFTEGAGNPPVFSGPRSSSFSWSWMARTTSQLRNGLISLPASRGTRSSASCQLPHRVPMPRMPLGPA